MALALLQALLRLINRAVPGRAKAPLWVGILRFRASVPRELLVNPGDLVLQVGTPRNETVERSAKAAGSKGRVVVVEAEHRNAERLHSFVRARRLTNVAIVAKGAWSERGTHRLLIAPRPGDHRLEVDSVLHHNNLRPGGYVAEETIEVDTIDNILAHVAPGERIGFVEVAVNGAEMHVLEGMEDTLQRTGRLFVKGHARLRGSGDPLNSHIVQFLARRGFRTRVTKPTESVAVEWGDRQGDVLAWRPA